jgi:hypothetical protein
MSPAHCHCATPHELVGDERLERPRRVRTAGSEPAGSTISPSRRLVFLERVGIEPTTQCLRGIVAWPWYMPSHDVWPGVRRSHPRLDGFNVALQLSQLTPDVGGTARDRTWAGFHPRRVSTAMPYRSATVPLASPVGIEPTSRVLESLSSPRLGLVIKMNGPGGKIRTSEARCAPRLQRGPFTGLGHTGMASVVRLERT